jgi:hypothetical protein
VNVCIDSQGVCTAYVLPEDPTCPGSISFYMFDKGNNGWDGSEYVISTESSTYANLAQNPVRASNNNIRGDKNQKIRINQRNLNLPQGLLGVKSNDNRVILANGTLSQGFSEVKSLCLPDGCHRLDVTLNPAVSKEVALADSMESFWYSCGYRGNLPNPNPNPNPNPVFLVSIEVTHPFQPSLLFYLLFRLFSSLLLSLLTLTLTLTLTQTLTLVGNVPFSAPLCIDKQYDLCYGLSG